MLRELLWCNFHTLQSRVYNYCHFSLLYLFLADSYNLLICLTISIAFFDLLLHFSGYYHISSVSFKKFHWTRAIEGFNLISLISGFCKLHFSVSFKSLHLDREINCFSLISSAIFWLQQVTTFLENNLNSAIALWYSAFSFRLHGLILRKPERQWILDSIVCNCLVGCKRKLPWV